MSLVLGPTAPLRGGRQSRVQGGSGRELQPAHEGGRTEDGCSCWHTQSCVLSVPGAPRKPLGYYVHPFLLKGQKAQGRGRLPGFSRPDQREARGWGKGEDLSPGFGGGEGNVFPEG